jgi:cytochrome c553
MSSAPSSGPRHARDAVGRCASCGARLRSEETWCSLCHAAVPEAMAADRWAPLLPAPAVEPVPKGAEPGADGEPDPAVSGRADQLADQLLAELAAAEALRAQQTGLGALQLRFGSMLGLGDLSERSRGIVLAVGGGIFMLFAGIIGLTLLGLLL